MDSLRRYRTMVDGLAAPVPVRRLWRWGDWRVPPPAEFLERCPVHGIYRGELECRLCDPEIQPLP
jgi:hypothetical protein